MINIITTSIGTRTRGPKKVVDNLMKGLELIGYPYVINRSLDAASRLWIHDDRDALRHLKDLPKGIKTVIGPNLFVNPKDIPLDVDISKTIYIQPSENVVVSWKDQGHNRSPLDVWAAGIDTETFKPEDSPRASGTRVEVVLYFKNRSEKELKDIEALLKDANLSYSLLRYGSYTEDEYVSSLKKARYMVVLDGSESQGIALEEAMAMDVPLLVIDKKGEEGSLDEQSTSVPYWNDSCGIRITEIAELPEAIRHMEAVYESFHPRAFILEHLELKKQAEKFVKLYETHFGLDTEEGRKEQIRNNASWKPPFKSRLKRFIKRIIR